MKSLGDHTFITYTLSAPPPPLDTHKTNNNKNTSFAENFVYVLNEWSLAFSKLMISVDHIYNSNKNALTMLVSYSVKNARLSVLSIYGPIIQ